MNKEVRGRYILPALLFLCCGKISAQVTFNKTIDFANGDDVASGVIELADGYFISGQGWGYEIGDYFDTKLKYAKLDLEGNVIYKRFIGDTAKRFYPGWNCLQTLDGNVIVAGGYVTLDDADADIQLIKFDPDTGDTIFHKIFESSLYSYGNSVQQYTDGSLLINAYDAGSTSTFLKTTSDGKMIWQKQYGTGSESTGSFFRLVNDSLSLFTSFGACDPEGSNFRQIDSAGIVVNETFLEDDCLYLGWKSKVGGYIGGGIKDGENPFTSYVFRADENANLQWKYSTSFDFDTISEGLMQLTGIEELPNGDILIGGYYASDPLGVYKAVVCKVNVEGDPYWERIYKSNSEMYDDNTINTLSLTSDGGFIMSGGAYSENVEEDQNFWALKLDSMGCLTPGCDSLDIAVMELPFNSEIALYPNPAHDFFVIQCGENFSDEADVLIINTAGMIVKQDIIKKGSNSVILHTEEIQPGFYLVKIIDQRNRVQVKKLIVGK